MGRIKPQTAIFSTGYDPQRSEGAAVPPVFRTSTFIFKTAAEGKRAFEIAYGLDPIKTGESPALIYTRVNNPNCEILEEKITAWDGAEAAALFSSGMGAISSTCLAFLKPGDTLVFADPVYGGTEYLFRHLLPSFKIRTVVRPPRPCAPMPSWLTFSNNSMRNSSVLFCGPRFNKSYISMSSINTSLAINIAFSAVPPMPMPSIPGGHQPAPMCGTVFKTQSTSESDGFSITNLVLFSEPPPLAATFTSTLLPGTTSMWITAGVLSLVFLRSNCGSATIDARSLLSTLL